MKIKILIISKDKVKNHAKVNDHLIMYSADDQ